VTKLGSAFKKASALEAIQGKVNVHYKADVVRKMPLESFDRIPTGSVALDYTLGCNAKGMGGLVVGAGNCFVGYKSSGKSTATAKCIAEFQRMCVRCYRYAANVKAVRLLDDAGEVVMRKIGTDQFGQDIVVPVYTITGRCSCYKEGIWHPSKPAIEGKVQEKKDQEEAWAAYLEELKVNSFEAGTTAYFDVEDTLDKSWVSRQGVYAMVYDEEYKTNCPVAQFIVVVPSTAQQCIDIKTEYMKSGEIDLFVVDSLAQLTPEIEIDSSTEDEQRGAAAKLLNKGLRIWTAVASQVRAETGKRITRVYIQQWRASMKPGGEKTMPGGLGQWFAFSTVTDFYTSGKEEKADSFIGDVGKKSEQLQGVFSLTQNFSNLKNKAWPPHKKGSHVLQLMDEGDSKGGAIQEYGYVMKLAIALNVIEKVGTKYKYRGEEYTAQSAITAKWAASPFLYRNTLVVIRRLLYFAVAQKEIEGAAAITAESKA
jgi:RecA/RadA recombinase